MVTHIKNFINKTFLLFFFLQITWCSFWEKEFNRTIYHLYPDRSLVTYTNIEQIYHTHNVIYDIGRFEYRDYRFAAYIFIINLKIINLYYDNMTRCCICDFPGGEFSRDFVQSAAM